jgi:putative spermidine/putrescine transport system ATP-binding protein
MLMRRVLPEGTNAAAHAAGRRLELQGVCKRYESGPEVVKDVSFTLEPGEFLTLLGPSGSGKTTTLMMVAGFELPSAGTIRVDDRDVSSLSPDQRNFGVVFQGYALFPHMTVQENVAFAMRMRNRPRAECTRRAREMLDKVGLADFADRKPRALSGGQQQRVALARALVFEPDALLLDEPLGALDRRLREAMQIEIKELQKRIGISILFVTHDQDEAMMMSDRIAVMNKGRIVQIGSPAEVYQHPHSAFVAGFLGETNLIPRGNESISVRPERIRFLQAGEAADHNVEGNVIDGTFLGRHARFNVRALGQRIVVSTADPAVYARVAPGDSVRLGWNAEDAQILAVED